MSPETIHSPPRMPAQAAAASSHRHTMLCPAAYDETLLPALRLARSSRIAGRIAKVLFAGLILTSLILVWAPWQQSVRGSGNVIAYAPLERQQIIESPIKGRIVRWGEGIVENARVTRGQLIAEIRDLDEGYALRLQQQLEHTEETVRTAREQIHAANDSFDASTRLVDVYAKQEQTYTQVKADVTAAQDAYVSAAVEKLESVSEQLSVEQAAVPQLQQEYARLSELQARGNISLQKVQEVEAKLQAAESYVRKAKADLASARMEVEGKRRDREAYIRKAQVDIDYAHGLYQKALSDAAKAEGEIAKAESELAKAEKELREMERKVAVQSNQLLMAPLDGYMVQITPNLGSSILKEGDPICTIVPETKDRAVQVWLKGNDVPLVHQGDHVRLQFEGWPAVQFSGWLSVAVGTFGGEVVSVDATDDGQGKFRILVRPSQTDQQWPDDRYLRQGVRANGWVLLEQVPLWWEVWRQLNSFPPVLTPDDDEKPGEKSKAPKPPKQ